VYTKIASTPRLLAAEKENRHKFQVIGLDILGDTPKVNIPCVLISSKEKGRPCIDDISSTLLAYFTGLLLKPNGIQWLFDIIREGSMSRTTKITHLFIDETITTNPISFPLQHLMHREYAVQNFQDIVPNYNLTECRMMN